MEGPGIPRRPKLREFQATAWYARALVTFLELPFEDSEDLMKERFPMPRFHVSKPGDGHERKLKVKVNPSSGNAQNQSTEGVDYFTEDVSLSHFMNHLIKLAVQS